MICREGPNSVAQAGVSGEVMFTRPSRDAINFDEIRIGVNKHQNSSSICLKAALSGTAKDSGNRVKEVMADPWLNGPIPRLQTGFFPFPIYFQPLSDPEWALSDLSRATGDFTGSFRTHRRSSEAFIFYRTLTENLFMKNIYRCL